MSKESALPSPPTPAWKSVFDRWNRVTRHMTQSAIEANRATAAAIGFPTSSDSDGSRIAPLESMAYRVADWEFESTTTPHDKLEVGDCVRFTKEITDQDVSDFARVSGDTNRLHLDAAFARKTRFGRRIVHGTLVSGIISAALARLPHLTIYLSQDLTFRNPVHIGETVTAECEVVEALGDDQYRLTTCVYDESDACIIDGEAIVLIDELPDLE